MRNALTALTLMLGLCVPNLAIGQSVEMPLPGSIVVDGDGKPVAQVAGFHCDNNNCWPMVILDIEGTPAFLIMQPFGLVDRVGYPNGPSVFFEGAGCTGTSWVNQVGGMELQVGTHFGVVGPDSVDGTYRLFRSTSTSTDWAEYLSWWANGQCSEVSGQGARFPAEEVIPNPLAGFHGPTSTEPDKTWTITGGDRLP